VIRNRPVSLALVGLFVWVTACTSYRQIEVAEVADYDLIELTTTSGEEVKIHRATVEQDSLRGQIQEAGRIGGPVWGDTIAIPLSQVETVRVIEADTGGTVAVLVLVPVGMLAIAAMAYGIACSGNSGYLC